MKFGFGLITCQQYAGDSRSDVDLYREALELAVGAELLGFDSLWVSEHHFWDDAYMPSLLVFCAAAAARTTHIKIGTAVVIAPFYEPLRLAEDSATVDLVSAGRLILGLGQGWMPHEFEALHVSPRGRHRLLEDSIAALRQAWSDELVTGGDVLGYPGVLVTPKPAQLGGPPIWLGGEQESAIRRAARIADGFMSASAFSPELLADQVSLLESEAELAGRRLDDFVLSFHRPTFAWHGHDAWERVRPYVYNVAWKYEDMQQVRDRRGPLQSPPRLTAEREARILGGRGLVGRPEKIVEQLLAYQDAATSELHFIARLYWPGMDHGLQRETIAIFAEEVISQVRAELRPAPTRVRDD